MTQPPTPPPQDSREFPSYAGPPVPPPDPAYRAPDPAYRSSVPAYMAALPPDPVVAGYGYPGVRIVGMSGLAIAALVCALVPFLFPVAIGLAIGALVVIRRSGERGAGLAVTALVASGLQTLVLVAFVGAGLSGGLDEPVADGGTAPVSAPEAPDLGDPTYVDELKPGDCFDVWDDESDEVYVVPCTKPHDSEMIAEVTLPEGAYPGDRVLDRSAGLACDKVFATYVGRSADDTALTPDFWTPDRDTWEAGDRVVVCTASGPDGELLTGSVKGTKR